MASRRHSEELIQGGRVTVDGEVATLGMSVDPEEQRVAVDGRDILAETKEYWVLNKPRGIVSTAFDPQGRPTVVEAVPSRGRVFPVGRLDLNSTGLLVLTNDGELTAQLLHPRFHVEKEYEVSIRGLIKPGDVARLRSGVELEDGWTAPARVDLVEVARTGKGPVTRLRMVIHEGRKRQIRRMMESVGHPVLSLHRHRFDGLTDAGLSVGQARRLSNAEVEGLRRAAEGSAKESR